jgi:phosphoribosylformylglycinamidine synthase I
MLTGPRVLILKADGTNCEVETAHGVALAGGAPDVVPVNLLRDGRRRLEDYDALILPGGFSYGDDVSSGKILAVELLTFLGDQLGRFVAARRPVLGICNGFQVLVRTGLLPFGRPGAAAATLAANASGRFECRWVRLRIERRVGALRAMPDEIELPVAHGEGRFTAPAATLDEIEAQGLVALRYIDAGGSATQEHPANPNGSAHAIAGVSDRTGLILGLMPHPERYLTAVQHPWRWRQPEPVAALAAAGPAVLVAAPRGAPETEPDGLAFMRGFLALA